MDMIINNVILAHKIHEKSDTETEGPEFSSGSTQHDKGWYTSFPEPPLCHSGHRSGISYTTALITPGSLCL